MKKLISSLWKDLCLRLRVLLAAAFPFRGDITPVGRLYARVLRADGSQEDLGLVSTKVVTNAGVNFLVDALQGLANASDFKFHGCGTGNTAEDVSQTGLVSEVGSRSTGSQTEGAQPNVYKTVGTVSFSNTHAIVEHGIFSAAVGGTLLDRSVFSAINVTSGDAIEFTYELTLPSGS